MNPETLRSRRESAAKKLAHAQAAAGRAASERALMRHLRRIARFKADLADLAYCLAHFGGEAEA